MEPLVVLAVAIACTSAGLIGALMGIGGGLIIIPILTLVFNVPVHEAIGASLIGIIASSTGAATKYVQQGLTNVRLALFLETATTIGSIIGALIAVYTNQALLLAIFSALLVYSAITMLRRTEMRIIPEDMDAEGQLVDLSCSYVDPQGECRVDYAVVGLRKGLGLSAVAGALSGLLGVGGGIIKVPVMNICMCVPLKAAAATSNFMIGVTALTGAVIYYGHGLLVPSLCAAVAIGAFLGAFMGTRLMRRYTSQQLRKGFAILMLVVAATMVMKAAGLWGGG